jgi:hypothetical protein
MAAALRWNEERISEIKHLLVDEGMTRAAIAAKVGVSKSSVIHAVQKYGLVGLSQRRDIAKAAGQQRRLASGYFRSHSLQTMLPSRCLRDLKPESSPLAKCWADFDGAVHSHWPLGKDAEGVFHFCGRPRMEKQRTGKQSAYCESHTLRSLRKLDAV